MFQVSRLRSHWMELARITQRFKYYHKNIFFFSFPTEKDIRNKNHIENFVIFNNAVMLNSHCGSFIFDNTIVIFNKKFLYSDKKKLNNNFFNRR